MAMGGFMVNVSSVATGWQEAHLCALAQTLPFVGATRNWQDKALAMFIEEGLPHRKIESWRYTPIHALLERTFVLPQTPVDIPDLAGYEIAKTQRLVLINGQVNLSLSTLDDDIAVLPLRELLDTADEAILREMRIELEQSFFACLNSALMHEGCYIKVNARTAVQRPLHVLHLSVDEPVASMRPTRVLIDVDRNAELSVLEEFVSIGDGAYFTNTVTQLNLNFDAKLRYFKLQSESTQAFHLGMTIASMSADAQLDYHTFTQGAMLSREDLYVRHFEPGSTVSLKGLFMTDEQQHATHCTRVDHFKGHASTHQHYRGVAGDQSQGVFAGKVVLHPGAIQSSVEQSNHNLLLSSHAEIDAKPNLEIYVDDVTASHGATVGQLDEDALFYLRARGVPVDQARAMLTNGFMQAMFDTIKPCYIVDHIKQAMLGEVLHG